jgi:hypothetical protein
MDRLNTQCVLLVTKCHEAQQENWNIIIFIELELNDTNMQDHVNLKLFLAY